eukprot:COSAG06_NODE_4400_length_4296_cov_2.428878_3_plen_35_part_00
MRPPPKQAVEQQGIELAGALPGEALHRRVRPLAR